MSACFTCPNCGALVPQNALACPECGSDAETGWSEAARYQELGFYLPDDDEPTEPPSTPLHLPQHWLVVLTALTIAAFVALVMPIGVYLAPLIFVAIAVVYYLNQTQPGTHSGAEKRLYQQLLTRAKGDQRLVERLIEYERQRAPQAARHALLQSALERWQRDYR